MRSGVNIRALYHDTRNIHFWVIYLRNIARIIDDRLFNFFVRLFLWILECPILYNTDIDSSREFFLAKRI